MSDLHSPEVRFASDSREFEAFAQDAPDTSRSVDVEMNGFAVSSNVLRSEGYHNCVSLAGIGKNLSLLGHFEHINTPGKGDNEAFLAAVSMLKTIGAGTILLAGGKPYNDGSLSDLRSSKDREYAGAIIDDYVQTAGPGTRALVHWTGEKPEGVDVAVNNVRKQIMILRVNMDL